MTSEQTDKDVAFIRALAALLEESDLGEIEVERKYGDDDELLVRLSRYSAAAPVMAAPAAMAAQPAPAALAAAPAAVAAPAEPATPAAAEGMVPSPMVGTVYAAPEPGAANFVAVGDKVTEGQTIVIIEAMKTMNHIPAPHSGTVTEIFISDAEPVEFGSPLMVIA